MTWLNRLVLGAVVGVAGFVALSLALSPAPFDFFGVDPGQGGVGWLMLRLALAWLLGHLCYWWGASRQGAWAAAGFGGLAGGILLVTVLGTSRIDPRNTEWLDHAGPGFQAAQQGWTEFRAESWTGSTEEAEEGAWWAGLGHGLLANGSIPLVALPAKAFSDGLPETFQYLGLWLLFCFCLHGALGGLLMRCLTEEPRLQMVGTGFFLLTPMLLGSLGHPASAAHWILLAGLWLYFRTWATGHPWRIWVGWVLLVILSLAVHGQLACMVVMLAATYLARSIWVDRSIGWGKGLFLALVLAGVVAGTGYVLGYQSSATFVGRPVESAVTAAANGPGQPTAWAPVDPCHRWWSAGSAKTAFTAFPLAELGPGISLLGAWSLLMLLMRPLDRAGARPWTPLLILGGLLTLVSLAPVIAGGSIPLLDLGTRLPAGWWDWLASAERAAWLVGYALTFLLIALLVHAHPPRRAALMLTLALTLQAMGLPGSRT